MARKNKPIRSDIAWSTPDRIEVHGKSLPDEILGHINLGDMAFLQIVGRMPTPQESNVFNAIAVTLVEHGITPSALVARLTYAGAPESLQAAVAAGLCGLGSVFVGSAPKAPPRCCTRRCRQARKAPTWSASRVRPWRLSARAARSFPGSAIRCTSRSIRAPRACSRSPRTTASPATTSGSNN
jgi:hypothetical protein